MIAFLLAIVAPVVAVFYVMYLMIKAAIVLMVAFVSWLIGLL